MRDTVQEGNGFFVKDNGEVVAEVTFVPVGQETLVLNHTYVAPELRGQKVAEDLVRRVVDHARETGKKVVPACSYAHAQFRRHKEYQDIWQRDEV
ncbi:MULTISPECIES: GNAT family N-acetyltransferase [Paenibacillus]|uniref:GNAT family N-acetyltransferase n=1 Tax=Paenibacillus TaxID=44249 RepID=UPI0022B8C55B|nr:GNAT family N-acetyltransferase [Paenibacillus caseinilyticus]MCZ8520941.1 GNAT family N-acetyltransferase [Paenibacillus caseinilyticus]